MTKNYEQASNRSPKLMHTPAETWASEAAARNFRAETQQKSIDGAARWTILMSFLLRMKSLFWKTEPICVGLMLTLSLVTCVTLLHA